MLFLSRKEGEAINLYTKDGVITVYMGQHRNGQTKIGLMHPQAFKFCEKRLTVA